MLASIIYNYGKFCDDFKSTLKLGAYDTSNTYLLFLSVSISCSVNFLFAIISLYDYLEANNHMFPFFLISWFNTFRYCGLLINSL
jgi:hypothetical protein